MTKKELIRNVAGKTGFTIKDTTSVINNTFDVIMDTLAGGDNVSLVGFGTFESVMRDAREGRNPQTGEKIQIAAHRTPKFKASPTLKNSVR